MKTKLLAAAVMLATSAVHADNPTFSGNAQLMDIHNSCIVRFGNDMPSRDVPGLAKGMAKAAGGAVTNMYKHSIKGFSVNVPCHAADKAFGNRAEVISMEPDGIVFASAPPPGKGPGGGDDPAPGGQETPWSVTRVGGATDGTGYTAWIIDSGIDLDHPDLNVDASRGFTSIRRGDMDDDNGHGTHVAGTVAALDNDIDVVGVAAGATVVPVQVLDRRGSGSWSGVIAGVDHVAANASPGDCANMSLGGGVTQALDDAVVAAAQASGAFFVLAAGNDGDHADNHSPARANGNRVFTISATDINDNLASWSNYGNPPVDYAAPGVGILSLRAGGGTTTMSGTSMASPAACAVIMLRNGNPSVDGFAGNDTDGSPDPIVHL